MSMRVTKCGRASGLFWHQINIGELGSLSQLCVCGCIFLVEEERKCGLSHGSHTVISYANKEEEARSVCDRRMNRR